jgi:hypothetical protein
MISFLLKVKLCLLETYHYLLTRTSKYRAAGNVFADLEHTSDRERKTSAFIEKSLGWLVYW